MSASSNSSNSHASSSRFHASNCFCRIRAPIKRAWTIANFGKLFAGCGRFPRPDACDYFVWVDTEMCPRGREFVEEARQKFQEFVEELGDSRAREIELQRDLRRNLKNNTTLEDRIAEKNRHIASLSSELDVLKRKLSFIKVGCTVILFVGLVIRFLLLKGNNVCRIDGILSLP